MCGETEQVFDCMLTSERPPWVAFVVRDDVVLSASLAKIEASGGLVRFLDAKNMSNRGSALQEIAKGLQFPYYFGHNWDALIECLGDLYSWLRKEVVVVVIPNSDELLVVDHLPILVDCLCDGAERAGAQIDDDGDLLDRPAVALHFVFKVDVSHMEEASIIVRKSGREIVIGDNVVTVA